MQSVWDQEKLAIPFGYSKREMIIDAFVESKFIGYPIGGRKVLTCELNFIKCALVYIPNTGYVTV